MPLKISILIFRTLPLLFSHYLIILKLSYHFHIILLLSHYLIIVRQLSLFITLSISLSAQEKLQLRLVLGFSSLSTTTEKCPTCSIFHSIYLYFSPFFSFSAIKCSENVQLAPFFLSTFLDHVQYSSATIFSNASEIIWNNYVTRISHILEYIIKSNIIIICNSAHPKYCISRHISPNRVSCLGIILFYSP